MSGEIAELPYESSEEAVMAHHNLINKVVDRNFSLEDRIVKLEEQIERLESLFSDEANETTRRALKLKEVLKEGGMISRPQAQNILGNIHHTSALDAMKCAAQVYEELSLGKNKKGHWVLKRRYE
jgi:hypothetical protein